MNGYNMSASIKDLLFKSLYRLSTFDVRSEVKLKIDYDMVREIYLPIRNTDIFITEYYGIEKDI